MSTKTETKTFSPRPGTKRAACHQLLLRKRGCTIADGEAATEWKPNVVLSEFFVLAGLTERKLMKVQTKKGGAPLYRLA